MKNKAKKDNLVPSPSHDDFLPEENHVEVSARDWQHIVDTAESNEVNPALTRAAMRYATRHK